jgi:hypothetical protein
MIYLVDTNVLLSFAVRADTQHLLYLSQSQFELSLRSLCLLCVSAVN